MGHNKRSGVDGVGQGSGMDGMGQGSSVDGMGQGSGVDSTDQGSSNSLGVGGLTGVADLSDVAINVVGVVSDSLDTAVGEVH